MEATKEYRENKIKDTKKNQIYLYIYIFKSLSKHNIALFVYLNI